MPSLWPAKVTCAIQLGTTWVCSRPLAISVQKRASGKLARLITGSRHSGIELRECSRIHWITTGRATWKLTAHEGPLYPDCFRLAGQPRTPPFVDTRAFW